MSDKTITVTIVNLENPMMLEFKIDPTETTYIRPEGSKFGFIFKPDEEQSK
jgi:hypothetical protein